MNKHDTEQIIRLICRDYLRRKEIIEQDQEYPSILILHSLLNKAIDDAVDEVYHMIYAYAPNFGEIMRQDIADCRGYANSQLSTVMSEGSYKKYKKMVKERIVQKLGLWETNDET